MHARVSEPEQLAVGIARKPGGLASAEDVGEVADRVARVGSIERRTWTGVASGASGHRPRRRESVAEAGFNFRLDRAAVDRLLGLRPRAREAICQEAGDRAGLGPDWSEQGGVSSGRGWPYGQPGQIAGLPLQCDLRLLGLAVFTPSTGRGEPQLRQTSARFAGRVRGGASLRLGNDWSFQGQVELTSIDLHTLNQVDLDSIAWQPGGSLAGLPLSSTDMNPPDRLRARSISTSTMRPCSRCPFSVSSAGFRLSARWVVQDGAPGRHHRQPATDHRILHLGGTPGSAPCHGTVGFDTELNLEVLVNTNQIIPETGQRSSR